MDAGEKWQVIVLPMYAFGVQAMYARSLHFVNNERTKYDFAPSRTNSDPMKAIGQYLDDAVRRGAAKNDSDVARLLGVTRAAVSDWRNLRRTPDDDQAVNLAKLLGIEPGEVLAECGAARARNAETRAAWERVAAVMAAQKD